MSRFYKNRNLCWCKDCNKMIKTIPTYVPASTYWSKIVNIDTTMILVQCCCMWWLFIHIHIYINVTKYINTFVLLVGACWSRVDLKLTKKKTISTHACSGSSDVTQLVLRLLATLLSVASEPGGRGGGRFPPLFWLIEKISSHLLKKILYSGDPEIGPSMGLTESGPSGRGP